MNLVEHGHLVNILPPVNINGGTTGDIFSMEHYNHATIIVQVGVSAAAPAGIFIRECTSFAAAGATSIAFEYYAETTALGDTLATHAAATAIAGIVPSANDNIMYVIELDASQLSDGSHFVQLQITAGANNIECSAIAILSGARYGSDVSPTEIV